ncbi:hypothetical protein [Streptomyces paradoxus]|uniref:hypothetical protein n=1 Tax=Streptomyces paradoxus TaxID=66375 RepID=UPI00382D3E82
MKFVQIIEFETEHLEEMQQVLDEAGQRNAARTGGPTHSTLLKTRTAASARTSLALLALALVGVVGLA